MSLTQVGVMPEPWFFMIDTLTGLAGGFLALLAFRLAGGGA